MRQEDALYYKQTGLINDHVLGQAVRKALQFDIPVKNDQLACKVRTSSFTFQCF